jgi:hypothetical protein
MAEIVVPNSPRRLNSTAKGYSSNQISGAMSPKSSNPALKSRRGFSLDSAAYRTYITSQQKETVGGGVRSLSASESANVMNRLEFENIDLLNTPLSSLRSCSEYNKTNPEGARAGSNEEAPKSKSFFQSLFSWKKEKKNKNKVRWNSKEDKVYMIESLRFNEANLLEGEDYNYRKRSEEIPVSSIHRSYDSNVSPSSSLDHSGSNGQGMNKRKKKRSGSTFFRESSAAWDSVFGYGPRNKNMPMEIELRDLRAPQLLNVYNFNEFDPEERLSMSSQLLQEEALGILGIRRVTSFGSFQRLRAESTESLRTSMTHSSAHSSGFGLATFDLWQPRTWVPWAKDEMVIRTALFRHFYSTHIRTRNDELFYECIRIQPFASGSYLRGMLSAGFCSMTFNIYNIMSWPELSTTAVTAARAAVVPQYNLVFEYVLYLLVMAQLVLNVVQLPFRLRLNSLCWDSSRVVEVDEAISFIRTMLHSDAWIFNRSLGLVLDILSLSMLVMCETFLWLSPSTDLMRPHVVSLCATSLLTLLIRLLVATVFGLSMHDPEVLSNARRRGLSKWDLETLPSFVFSSNEDVNNEDCCICLGCFELGEMLTCLPCDKKHSFHAGCIRSWLERQNSCPLCQKMV